MNSIKCSHSSLSVLCITVASFTVTRDAACNQIYNPSTSFVDASVGDVVPAVERVPGKRFTDSFDMDYAPIPHAIQPNRIGRFDGFGGAANDLRLSDFATSFFDYHIDAQSQVRDILFEEVRDNRVPLVVSTSFDQMLGGSTALAAEHTTGAVTSFADRSQVVSHPHPGGQLRDIDSVDLWGVEPPSLQAGFYSFADDPNNTSVYTLQTIAAGFLMPYLSRNDIAGALGNPNLAPLIDVDALMVHDVGTGFNPFDGTFGPGDSVMFSIAPIPNPEGGDFYDGGEIWVWEHGSPAEYLVHGGHRWDTAFDVQGTFRVNTENIDAIEAAGVPEPGSIAISVGALAFATLWYRYTG